MTRDEIVAYWLETAKNDGFGEDIIKETLKLMKIRRKIDTRIEPHPLRKDTPFVNDIIAG